MLREQEAYARFWPVHYSVKDAQPYLNIIRLELESHRAGCTSDTKTLSLVLTLVLRLVEFDGNIGHVIPGVVDADE